jgi:class I fructose-bisphosphate aldolase
MATDRVKQILSWYGSDNPGVKANLARMLNHGTLAGTGKMVILPVDQGFEHGPARSFQPNPDGYDPDYHYAARHRRRLQRVRGAARLPRGRGGQVRRPGPAHPQAEQLGHARQGRAPVQRDHRLGGGRAPPGLHRHRLHDLPGLGRAQRACTRTSASSSRGQARRPGGRRLGVPARLRHLEGRRGRRRRRRLRGADRLRSSARTSSRSSRRPITSSRPEAKKVFEKAGVKIPTATLADRVRHVRAGAFNGKRIVIFSGGEAKGTDERSSRR